MINERLPTVMSNLSRKLRINSALVDFNYDSKRAATSLVVKSVLQMDKKCSLMVFSLRGCQLSKSNTCIILPV